MAKKNYTFDWHDYLLFVPEIKEATDKQILQTEATLNNDYEVNLVCVNERLEISFLHHTAHIKRNEVEEIIYKIFK